MRRTIPFVVVFVLGLASCQRQETTPSPEVWKAFVGALLIDGRGVAPIPNSVLLVRDGRIEEVADVQSATIPAEAEIIRLKGEVLIPGLINSHGHVGSTTGLESGPDYYSTETVVRDLDLYAHYGVTTVVSLGDDHAPGFEVRENQEHLAISRARLYVAGPVLTPSTPEEAVSEVRRVAKMKPDFIKIRVDDNLGQTRKMSPEVYRAVIEESHRLGLRVAVHVYYLEDAKELVRAGADFLAHSVRDQDIDEELISLMKDRNVCLSPTLTRELSAFVYGTTPEFFEDPFFRKYADPAVIQELQSPERQRQVKESVSAAQYRVALQQALRNLKKLSEAGVGIAFGTDSGPPGRFQGYFEHLELELMAEAGLSPEQILVSATSGASECVGNSEIGVLEKGRWADFVVLRGNPLSDITLGRSIESVWIAGNRVE